MNYELAKKLKDAGYTNYSNTWSGTDAEPNPTLSELIEACVSFNPKTSFGLGLKQVSLRGHCSQNWWATNHVGKMGEGENPEEAVANLWLELNKK